MVSFAQSISTRRYVHRREQGVVPLENPSSVVYGIKKILISSLYRELSSFVNQRRYSVVFLHNFRIFDQIFVNFAKIGSNC